MSERSRTPLDPNERVSTLFSHRIVAAAEDVDMMGHISNVAYVRWIQDVALAHSHAAGWDLDRYFALGAAFLVRRHEVDYLRPAFTGDLVESSTWIERWTAATSVRYTVIRRVGDDLELIRSRTIWALVTRETGRPRRIPREIELAFLDPTKAAARS